MQPFGGKASVLLACVAAFLTQPMTVKSEVVVSIGAIPNPDVDEARPNARRPERHRKSENFFETCFEAIEKAEAAASGLPPGLMLAVAKTESGRKVSDQFVAWPWTLNIAGEGRYFPTRSAAVAVAKSALEEADLNVDLGCMQINETWHGVAFANLDAMIDPVENVSYAAELLLDLRETHGNWRDAIAHYHSSNPVRGFAYAERVLENWRNNPDGAAFIATDASLDVLPRLAEAVAQLPKVDDIEAEYFATVLVSERFEVSTAYVVEDDKGTLFVSLDDLKSVPFEDRYTLPLALYDDTIMLQLSKAVGFDTKFDKDALRLEVVIPGDFFPAQVSTSRSRIRAEEITSRAPGGHLNYTLSAHGGALLGAELKAVLDGFVYWQNRTLRGAFQLDDDLSWRRLSSSLTIDQYRNQHQLIIGDTITPAASSWGDSHPIFGLSWGTNYSLDPSFSTLPDYAIYGVNDVPAVARFLVDGEQVRQTELNPGPYEFYDLPFPDAFGNMTVEVEDVLGRTQRFNVPYIRIPNLYREGLHTYSYGIGAEKVTSDTFIGEFGGLVAASTHRYGFSDTFTGEVHGKISAGSISLGVSGDMALLEADRLLSVAAAASYSSVGAGFQAGLSFGSIQRNADALFRGSVRFTSHDFHTGTQEPVADQLQSRFDVRLVSSLGGALPFTISYEYSDRWDGKVRHRLRAGRTWAISDGWSASVSGTMSAGSNGSSERLFVGLSKSFGEESRVRGRISNRQTGDGARVSAMVRRSKPSGPGVGYYARTSGDPGTGWFERVSFGLDGEAENFTYSARGRAGRGNFDGNATLSGSIGFLDGDTFLASNLRSSYVLVRSGEAEDLPIRLNYNFIGETGSDGLLISDGLRRFSRNRVEFRAEDLGFDFSLDGVSQTRTVVPVALGGYVVDFPIKEQYPATVQMVDVDGAPLSSGAIVFNADTEESARVTTDGKVFLENVGDGQRLEVDLGRLGNCEVTLTFTNSFDKFDVIGPFVCD